MSKIKNALGHFITITNHKMLVMKSCFKVGLYKQGLLHDLSKYNPCLLYTSDPIGEKVKIYTSNAIYSYTIIGIYEYKSKGTVTTASEEKLTTDLYIPVTAVKTSSTDKNLSLIHI